METPIQVDLGRIAQDLQIRRVQVESVVQLLDEGNTVPFITRYRKERTGNLNEVALREIQVRVGRLRELAERKETILKAVEAQGKLTDELAAAIRGADNPKRLEDLYLPYKPKKKTKASDAREKGFEPLALRVWNRDETLTDLAAAAHEYVSAEKGVENPEQVLEGVGHILAEAISEMATVRDAVRRVVWKTGKVGTTRAENVPDGEGLEYRDYYNYSEPIAHIPPHRVLAINRGDKEGPLKVKLEVSRPDLEQALFGQLPLEGHPQGEIFRKSAADALDRLLLPSMEREVRRDLTEMAERHAVDVFARNLRSLLLQPPIPNQVVLAIDPGFRTGCKVAVLDPHGALLEQLVIHPHPPQNRRSEAKVTLKDLVAKYQVGVVAIGNGTACRETEELVAEIITEGTQFSQDPEAARAALAVPAPEPESEPVSPEAVAPEPAAEDAAPVESIAPAAAELTPEPAVAVATDEPAAEEPAAPEAPEALAASENGSTPGAEAPVEALPPISGGAPDEATSELESAPAGEEAPPAPVAEHAPHEAEAEAEAAPTSAEASPEAPVEATSAASDQPPAESAPESASESAPAEGAAETTPTPEGAPATAEGGRPPRGQGSGGRSGGRQGKSDQPRPPRPKPVQHPPRPHPADTLLAQLSYVIVNEAGASVYSASPIGREEFPEFDATLRSAISIGRRLQDPLSEMVKIEPQNIGVGLYQHDVNAKQLKESLDAVISSCVNFVGVDLNTASVPLLRHVSGLNQLTARRVVERRKEKGPYTNRAQLQDVEGVGPATFTQAAGFLKLREGENALDRTWVHPESYPTATSLLEKLGLAPEIVRHKDLLPALHEKLNEADLPALAKELEVGEPTLRDICDALARPDRDPREDLPKPIFKKGVLKLEDLQAGMELKGTVLNVVDFGAFVDIGLKDSGLVHISQLANRYIKSPHDVVSVGDVVTAWVMGVDHERKRVSLTMVKPGTERPRGGPPSGAAGGGGGGGRRGQQEQREPRGGQREGQGQGRPPRREPVGPSALAGQAPVGTPPAQGSGEGPPPRSDRPGGYRGQGPGGARPGGRDQGRGPRPPHSGGGPGPGQGRFERAQTPRPPARPNKPAPPPPPLSKDALTGSVPLRTFGQLKQLWQAREGDEPGPEGQAPPDAPPTETPGGEPENP